MTEIAFTKTEGGMFEYFISPLSEDEIMQAVAYTQVAEEDGPPDFPAIFRENGEDIFYPDGDTLPRFNAIVLTDGSRWDATNCKWTNVRESLGRQAWYVEEVFSVLRRKSSWLRVPLEGWPVADPTCGGFFPRTVVL